MQGSRSLEKMRTKTKFREQYEQHSLPQKHKRVRSFHENENENDIDLTFYVKEEEDANDTGC